MRTVGHRTRRQRAFAKATARRKKVRCTVCGKKRRDCETVTYGYGVCLNCRLTREPHPQPTSEEREAKARERSARIRALLKVFS